MAIEGGGHACRGSWTLRCQVVQWARAIFPPWLSSAGGFTPVKRDTLTASLPINQGHLLLALEHMCQRETFGVRIPGLLTGCPTKKLDHLSLKMHQLLTVLLLRPEEHSSPAGGRNVTCAFPESSCLKCQAEWQCRRRGRDAENKGTDGNRGQAPRPWPGASATSGELCAKTCWAAAKHRQKLLRWVLAGQDGSGVHSLSLV